MYSRPSAWACSMKGAFVVVRPAPTARSDCTPAMVTPAAYPENLLPLVPPCRDARSLRFHLHVLGRPMRDGQNIGVLGDHRLSARVDELDGDRHRDRRDGLAGGRLGRASGGSQCE